MIARCVSPQPFKSRLLFCTCTAEHFCLDFAGAMVALRGFALFDLGYEQHSGHDPDYVTAIRRVYLVTRAVGKASPSSVSPATKSWLG